MTEQFGALVALAADAVRGGRKGVFVLGHGELLLSVFAYLRIIGILLLRALGSPLLGWFNRRSKAS